MSECQLFAQSQIYASKWPIQIIQNQSHIHMHLCAFTRMHMYHKSASLYKKKKKCRALLVLLLNVYL